MNSTTYCTAVSRRAETFSSRPNINPQFQRAHSSEKSCGHDRCRITPRCARWKRVSEKLLEGYRYCTPQVFLLEILNRTRKFVSPTPIELSKPESCAVRVCSAMYERGLIFRMHRVTIGHRFTSYLFWLLVSGNRQKMRIRSFII